jgi:type I restriction enzyme, S subunit
MRSEPPDGWLPTRLGEHVDLLVGFAFKSSEFTDDLSGIRLLRGDNVGHGRLRWNGVRRWPRERSAEFERYEVRPGDVVLAMDRPWIEAGLKHAMVRGDDVPCLLVQRVARLRGTDTLSQQYLRYVIASPEFTSWVKAVQTGTAVPHISGGQIEDYPFFLPPRPEQERITSVLQALDEKVDSDRRLEALLERIAATIFRARFIDFVGINELQESEIGLIPRGWTVSTVGGLARVERESIQPADAPEEVFEHFSLPAFDNGRHPELSPGATILSGKTRLPAEDFILVSKLNLQKTWRVWWPRPTGGGIPVCSSEFLVLAPRHHVSPAYLFALLSSDHRLRAEILSHVSGTTGSRQRVKAQDVLASRVLEPDAAAIQALDLAVRPLYAQAHHLHAESRSLAALRDALLPKLVAGDIRVPDVSGRDEMIGSVAEQAVA